MMRSLFSGVAGMKAHQTKLDVVGNNIANVNTYGFKSSRATFRDMYYQQLRGASAGTNTRGGINPSSVGYGSQLSSIDVLMTQSAMTSTGNPLDVAITGEGFLQVQDADGNIFYTKAGMLDIDPQGRLVDTNGNLVLGTKATGGQLNSSDPGRSIIKIEIDPVEANEGELITTILGRKFTISSDTQNSGSNASFTFASSGKKTDGSEFANNEMLEVILENGSSNIAVRLNENYTFTSMAELSAEINKAITEANGGVYEGGQFTFELEDFPTDGLTGAELVSSKDNSTSGKFTPTPDADAAADPTKKLWSWAGFSSFGSSFSGDGEVSLTVADAGFAADGVTPIYTLTADVNGTTYTSAEFSKGGVIRLQNGTGSDYLDLKVSDIALLAAEVAGGNTTITPGSLSPATPSSNMGLGKETWTMEGGTEGGPQYVDNLNGISIGANGVIVGTHPVHGRLVLGRIDLANFSNSKGLEQSGNSYFVETANSGEATYAIAGEDGTGALRNSALEMSNVDLSQEFTEMITTQRGFQANSRIITVSDTMLEELINLKR